MEKYHDYDHTDELDGAIGEGMSGLLRAMPGADSLLEIPANKLHSYRTTSQRSLGTPVSFSTPRNVAFAAGEAIVLPIFDLTRGILPGGVPIRFYDDDERADRARIDGLVFYGLRATVSCVVAGDLATDAPQQAYGDFICQYVKDSLEIRYYADGDARAPIVHNTALAFFARPEGGFLPTPPAAWINNNPYFELVTNDPIAEAYGNEAAKLTDYRQNPFPLIGGVYPVFDTSVNVALTIQIEGLWAPDPSKAGKDWPGSFMPIANIAGYDGCKTGCVTSPLLDRINERARPRTICEVEAEKQITEGLLHRTVNQRSMNSATIWRANPEILVGDDLYDKQILSAGTGILPGNTGTGIFGGVKLSEGANIAAGASSFDPTEFNRQSFNPERQRADKLALVAMRANFSIQSGFPPGLSPPLPAWVPCALSRELEKCYSQWVGLKIFPTADPKELWVADSTISYFNRPDKSFVPVPGIMWLGKEAYMELVQAPGQVFNLGQRVTDLADKRPNLFPWLQPLYSIVTLRIECLWALAADRENWLGVNMCGSLSK